MPETALYTVTRQYTDMFPPCPPLCPLCLCGYTVHGVKSDIFLAPFASFAVKKRTNRKVREGLRKGRKEDSVITKKRLLTKVGHTPRHA